MRSISLAAAAVAAMLVLSGCDNTAGSAPGAVSEGEAQALQEAAEMLDERQLPEGALPPTELPAESADDPTTPEEATDE